MAWLALLAHSVKHLANGFFFGVVRLEDSLSVGLTHIAQLEEVLVALPEVNLCALVLVPSHLVQDAQVSHLLLRVELLTHLPQQLLTHLVQPRVVLKVMILLTVTIFVFAPRIEQELILAEPGLP